MKVLVTGAAGFIGSHVARLLAASGDEVIAVERPGASLSRIVDISQRIDLCECDLGDFAGVRELIAGARPEMAMHLAWYAVPGKYWTAPENLDCVAHGMNLARALSENSCHRLVVAGTCAEYDWSHERLYEESTPCRPGTLYGAAKHALHVILERFCELQSVELAWLRYNFIYGPDEAPGRLVGSVIEKLLAGEDAPCTEGRQMRDFMHVEDVASATVAVLKSGVTGAVNVASGEPVSVREVVETLARIIGGPGKPVFGAVRSNAAEATALIPDVTRLTCEVGWHPRADLAEGLRRTLEQRTLRGSTTCG